MLVIHNLLRNQAKQPDKKNQKKENFNKLLEHMGKRILPRRLAEGQDGMDCEKKKCEGDCEGEQLGEGVGQVAEAGLEDGFVGGGHGDVGFGGSGASWFRWELFGWPASMLWDLMKFVRLIHTESVEMASRGKITTAVSAAILTYGFCQS